MPVYDWDEIKRAINIADHKIDFTAADNFDWDTAVIEVDIRENYGELREMAFGFIGVRLHALLFTRRGSQIRIISLRKADKKESGRYAQAIGRRDVAQRAATRPAGGERDD